MLTAAAVVVASAVILFDPIFQGLAISLMGGTIASTVLTLLVVPLVYYLTERKNYPDQNKPEPANTEQIEETEETETEESKNEQS